VSVPHRVYYESPIGWIEIGGSSSQIFSLCFVDAARAGTRPHGALQEAVRELGEYFAGARREFDLDLALRGTMFQEQVWAQLLNVPYGRVLTYQDVADAIGQPRAVRAVGAAIGRNPISIVVPCHRIVGSDGRLTGYGGGLWRKEWLLRHEGYLLL
jgi:methylated-DNA-[protein]-cysteine S-methyltransferase